MTTHVGHARLGVATSNLPEEQDMPTTVTYHRLTANARATIREQMPIAAYVPTEELDEYDDNGTMPQNVGALHSEVVGHRIVKVELAKRPAVDGFDRPYGESLRITLDTGRSVWLEDGDDCCAYTTLYGFIFHADKIDHVITGVRTEDGYTKWSIFADAGDVLELTVGWSCGNPFYYGYGFDIFVDDEAVQ